MQTLEYLTSPDLAPIFWPPILTGMLIAVLGAVLSVFVVLKRMAFIGQGVSHAAFGGVGLAYALGITGATALGELGLLAIVAAFAVLAALTIAGLSSRSRVQTDTAIGIVLSVAMAGGFLLIHFAGRRVAHTGRQPLLGVEEVLFGSIGSVGWLDVIVASVGVVTVLVMLWWHRRSIMFWAFDEAACEAFGVRVGATRSLVLVLLACSVVIAMKLAGVVLATAVFVLPGAIALALSRRLRVVLITSLGTALFGVIAGVIVSFELDLQTGPSIVLVLGASYAAVRAVGAVRRRTS